MSNLAIDDKGNAMTFDGKEWKPAPIAESPSGDRMAFDGKEWRALPKSEKPGAFDGALKTADSALDFVNRNVVNPIGTGLTKGVTALAGAPRTAADLLEAGATWAGEKVGAPETGRKIGAGAKFAIPGGTGPRSEEMNRMIFGGLGVPEENFGDKPALTLTNPFGVEGKVNLGKMADVGIQAIPGSLALGGGALAAFMGGVTSEAAGQATAGSPWEPVARVFGGLPGAWFGSKLATPLPAKLTPQQARAVQIAKETKTPLSVAQETGRGTALERFFSRMPGGMGPSERLAARQGAATDQAALAEAGFKGNELGQETMKAVAKKAGGAFDEAIANTPRVELRPDFYNKGGAAIGKYTENIAASEIIPKVANKLDDFFDPKLMKGGNFPELSGQQYQNFRSDIGKSVTALYNNGKAGAAEALKGVRDALDDAAGASQPAAQTAAWREARKNYANFKILQKAMNMGTTSARSEGTLGAAALTNALRRRQGDKFYQTTGGLNDIATLKGYLRDTSPNSGTPTATAQAFALLNPFLAGAPAAAVNLGQRAMTGGGPISSVVRNYLANQARPNTMQDVARVPFALAPGILTDQRGRR